jgi:hypothetical protein
MKLITEMCKDVKCLTEDVAGDKKLYIQGTFMQSGMANRNGRVYPTDVLNAEVDRYMSEYVAKNRAMGELGHPDSPIVNLDRVSHIITDLRVEGKNIWGKARIIANLIDAGVQLAVSSRGLGTLISMSNGIDEVQEDFNLAAVDIVSDPSAPEAFVQGILEGKEWVRIGKNKIIERATETARTKAQKITGKQKQEQAMKMFAKFLLDVTRA